MNINLEIKVDSPELMTAILRLAEALPQLSLGSFSLLEGDNKVELITPVINGEEKLSKESVQEGDLTKAGLQSEDFHQSKPDEQVKVQLDTIKVLLKEICDRDKMLQVLSKYGAKKVSQLQEKDYKLVIKDLEECLCQLSTN